MMGIILSYEFEVFRERESGSLQSGGGKSLTECEGLRYNGNIMKKTRVEREKDTVAVMIAYYCRQKHSSQGMCAECSALLEYAIKRLGKCPFGEGKTTCDKCPVHCYKADMRSGIRSVMRFSGPRMLYTHPFLAIRHLIDSRRKKPLTRI
jgi:hypothetical protein